MLRDLEIQIDDLRGSPQYESYEAVIQQVDSFRVLAATISALESRQSPTVSKKAAELKRVVGQVQAREFPTMRRAWSKFAGERLWPDGVEVTTIGESSHTLSFFGGVFAADGHVRQTQQTLSAHLSQLRFKRVQYHWTRSANAYTVFLLQTSSDRQVIAR